MLAAPLAAGLALAQDRGAAIDPSLPPRFFQTSYFYVAVALLAGAVVVVAYRLLVRRVRQREQMLAQLVEARTADLEAAKEQLRELTTNDPITGVANHRQFQDFLRAEWRRALREASPLSVIMIDIDHFKDYNESFGHQSGDACLRQVATALKGSIGRPGDLVARYGGEEFGTILARTDAEGAYRLAHKLRTAVEALRIPNPQAPTGGVVTVSVGVTTATPAFDSSWEELELVAAADRALQDAKQAGRNRIAVRAVGG